MSAVATPSAVSTGTKAKASKPKASVVKSAPSAQPTKVKPKAKVEPSKAKVSTAEPERKYGLDSDKAKELIKAKAYNAYRPGSTYACIIEALHSLGVGKMHTATALLSAVQKEMDKADLKSFKSKEKRNDTTGLDWKERILQSAYVTSRQDYGKRQRDIGWETRCDRDDNGNRLFGLFRLNGAKK